MDRAEKRQAFADQVRNVAVRKAISKIHVSPLGVDPLLSHRGIIVPEGTLLLRDYLIMTNGAFYDERDASRGDNRTSSMMTG
jgi:hypothetical protein